MLDGEMDAGAWSCGMVVGLIQRHPYGEGLTTASARG